MQDMLVKLYDLNDRAVLDAIDICKAKEILVRRAMAYEKERVREWVRAQFSAGWAAECETAWSNSPISCYIAVAEAEGRIIGFACYDVTWRNAFGPTGVHESVRGRGAGQALLLACMAAMKADGYAYAIIAGVGPLDFYRKVVGAEIIPGSSPGFYPPFLAKAE